MSGGLTKKTKPPIRRFFIPQDQLCMLPPPATVIAELFVPTPTNESVPVASPSMGELPPRGSAVRQCFRQFRRRQSCCFHQCCRQRRRQGCCFHQCCYQMALQTASQMSIYSLTAKPMAQVLRRASFLSRWARLGYLSCWAHLPTHSRDIHQSVPGPNIDRQHLAWNFWYIQNHIA